MQDKMKQHLIPKVQLYFAPSNATKETWAVCPSILPSKQQKELKELAVDTLQLGKCLVAPVPTQVTRAN